MVEKRARILIVDDEPIKRSVMEDELREAGYTVQTAATPLEAEPLMKKKPFDVILTDLRMPGQDGLSFLKNVREKSPEQTVIVMTAYGTVATAVEAMKLGAYDYLEKPFSTEQLLLKLSRALHYGQLALENEALRRALGRPEVGTRIVGSSEAIRHVLQRIHTVAALDTTVLIEGESGTGKELVARTLHEASHRSAGPFIAVSCAALPVSLTESELFGHEPGAFTGATKRRLGRFECAHGGTIFLDDVEDTPLEVQVKLLRVLQERSFERVGGEHPVQVNVRVIAATKVPLAKAVADGTFRQDLYYRLSVVPLVIPPLRERLDDIPVLVECFAEKVAIRMGRPPVKFTSKAIAKLQQHSWPGNVRELEHIIERMVAVSESDELDEAEVPELVSGDAAKGLVKFSLDTVNRVDMAGIVGEVEEQLVRWALGRCGGNVAKAAEILGVPRSTLQYKLGKIGAPDEH